ncbi:MAG: hypothetical protein R3E50_04085 [Halioglobus sp.]
MPTLTFSSDLPVPAEEILATLTMEGVNAELSPLVRMTAPVDFAGRSILLWPQKQFLFKSWILLFGFMPIDRHSFYFEAINPDSGFCERSTSITNECWRHERKILPLPNGSRVVDTVEYESRVPLLDVILKPLYKLVFWRRHQNLRSMYGGSASNSGVRQTSSP